MAFGPSYRGLGGVGDPSHAMLAPVIGRDRIARMEALGATLTDHDKQLIMADPSQADQYLQYVQMGALTPDQRAQSGPTFGDFVKDLGKIGAVGLTAGAAGLLPGVGTAAGAAGAAGDIGGASSDLGGLPDVASPGSMLPSAGTDIGNVGGLGGAGATSDLGGLVTGGALPSGGGSTNALQSLLGTNSTLGTLGKLAGAGVGIASGIAGAQDQSKANALNTELLAQIAAQRKQGQQLGRIGAVGNPFSSSYGSVFQGS